MVFNTISNKHVFLLAWKTSHIITLYKEVDKQDNSNYGLLSLLTCVSKVIETLIFSYFFEHVGAEIFTQQHGFTKNKSKITQMSLYLRQIFENLDRSTLATVYLDFEKAFDSLSRETSRENGQYRTSWMSSGPAREPAPEQKTKIEDWVTISTELDAKIVVPQGFVLGFFSFNVFINDLRNCVLSSCFGYADDYKIVGTNPVTLQLGSR